METVTLTIDGRRLTVPKGMSVLQASIEAGIQVPYYCYHPGLGIDGSCRVCIVKIEKMPKLQTSCSTLVAEGMVVHTQAPDGVDARASFIVCDSGADLRPEIFKLASTKGWQLRELRRQVGSLEDYFVQITYEQNMLARQRAATA